MFNLRYLYDQHSTRIQIEGFPDKSIGHNNETIGIITSWKLEITGNPELEGKKEHLQHLLNVIYPYSRNYLIGIRETFGASSGPVSITPCNESHKLTLRSSKKEVAPLSITLDNAEFIDLITCLDKFRADPRIRLSWDYSYEKYNKNKLKVKAKTNINNFLPPLLAFISLTMTSFLFLMIQNNNRIIEQKEEATNITNVDKNIQT